MSDDTYRTIAAPSTGSYSEKRSKFIAYAFPVQTEEEAKACLVKIQKKHADARHHCFAYVLGPHKEAWRVNDNGEPSGTAGRPIHGQMLSKDVTDIIIIVVRYFGGIKLGVSGLQNAYKTAARAALENANIIVRTIQKQYEICFDYMQMNAVMQTLKDPDIQILSQDSDMRCTIKFSVRLGEADRIVEILSKIPQAEIKSISD